MEITYDIVLPDVPLFQAGGQRDALIEGMLVERVELVAQYLAGVVSRTAPVNFGHLAQSFGALPATAEGGIDVQPPTGDRTVHGRVFSSLPHAIVMEEGRTPGARMPPLPAIALWAQRKLGLGVEEAEAAAYVIARSIARKGIEGRHFAQKAVDQSGAQIDAIFEMFAQELVSRLQGGR